MRRRKKIIIVGAGAGGLSAGALLAADFEVEIIERARVPGGKIRSVKIGDTSIDAGPTVFTMRWVFEELFARAGGSFADAVETEKLAVLARHYWKDGSTFDLLADPFAAAAEVERFAGAHEAQRYRSFCSKSARIYQTLLNPFMRAERPSLAKLAVSTNPLALGGIDPFSTLWDALGREFSDPRLRQLFARYATYCGSSPFSAPATLMLIAHVEQAGVWTVKGGMSAVASAMAALCERRGAAFRYGSHVDAVEMSNGRTAGVRLQSGEFIEADIVIFNGDPGCLDSSPPGRSLLSPDAARAAGVGRTETNSQSAITFAFEAKTPALPLDVHNVFFSDDYRAEFDAVFNRKTAPSVPTTYIFAPDRSAAPPHKDRERFFCLINAPPAAQDRGSGEEETLRCRDAMFRHLKTCGLELAPMPETLVTTTPAEFADMFPGSRGALYGRANHGWRASFERPGVRTRLPGLYLTGGGVHPGPGVPMAALSGMAAAAAVSKDFAST